MAPLSGSVTVNYPVVTLPASGPESYPSDSVDPIHLHSKSTSVHTVTSRFASAPGDAQVQKVTGPGALKTRGHHTASTSRRLLNNNNTGQVAPKQPGHHQHPL